MSSAASFLKPVRDLAENFGIDIASCLEEYLADLAKLKININVEGVTTEKLNLNFAEAALLIQGSSAVYARKVEHLHALVYKTLEALTEKKKNKKTNSSSSGDAEADDVADFDIELNFLLLDDAITTGSKFNIDLIDEEDLNQSNPNSNLNQSTTSRKTNPNDSDDDYYDDDVELNKQGMTNNSRRMSNISQISRASAAMTSLVGDIGQNGLRLTSCDVDSSGALLLAGSRVFGEMQNQDQGVKDDDNFMHNDEDNAMMDDNNDNNDNNNNNNNFNNDTNQTDLTTSTANNTTTNTNSSFNDPWAALDPNDKGRSRPRPMKTASTFTLPPSLLGEDDADDDVSVDMNDTNTSSSSANGGANASIISNASNKSALMSKSLNKTSFLEDSGGLVFKGLAYGSEFDYILKAESKRTKLKKRKEQQQMQIQMQSRVEEESSSDEEDLQLNMMDENDLHVQFDDDLPLNNVDEHQFQQTFGHVGENLDEERAEQDALNETRYEEKFELLCRQHLQSFSKAAERYAAETQLSKRVSGWNTRLQPILENEEDREEFHIHKSAAKILARTEGALSEERAKGKKGGKNLELVNLAEQKVAFDMVTKNESQYEVCRLFLSSLLLANSENIVLSHNEGGEQVENSLVIELKNSELEGMSMSDIVA